MKHIKLFNTDTQYQEFASDIEQPIPNVSYVTETDEVHYNESDPILFAYEYQADKFVMGVVIGSDIYVDTYETGFIVADGSGKFSTALAYTNDDLINIQNAIKDHYHLAASTIKTKAPLIEYAVGDSVPNWNAFEKIMLPKTLFAFESNPNNLIVGEIEGDTLRIQMSGNSNNVWLSSEIGVIKGTIQLSATDLEILLQAVNEKYGTSFEGWSQLPTAYEVGDTVPNWNAYEKIEMLSTKVAVEFENNNYFYGYIKGDTFFVSSMDSYAVSLNNNGIVLDTQAFPVEMVYNEVSGSLQRAGFNVSSASPNEVIVDVDEQIENWNDYQIIPKQA